MDKNLNKEKEKAISFQYYNHEIIPQSRKL